MELENTIHTLRIAENSVDVRSMVVWTEDRHWHLALIVIVPASNLSRRGAVNPRKIQGKLIASIENRNMGLYLR